MSQCGSFWAYPTWNLLSFWCNTFISFVKFGKFLASISSNNLSSPFSSSYSFGTPIMHMQSHGYLRLSPFFWNFFPFFFSDQINSINLSSCLLILPSSLSIWYQTLLVNFSYQLLYFFNSWISIWSLYTISVSLLTFSIWWDVVLVSFSSLSIFKTTD